MWVKHDHLRVNGQAANLYANLPRYPARKALVKDGAEVLSLRRPTSERRNHIPFSTVIGWSGLAAALSGVLFALWGYVESSSGVYPVRLLLISIDIRRRSEPLASFWQLPRIFSVLYAVGRFLTGFWWRVRNP